MSFKLDEPFIEETLDGRKTETIATRVGKCNKTQIFENNDKTCRHRIHYVNFLQKFYKKSDI